MTYYCTYCWAEVKKNETVCPHCGADQDALNRELYVDKLIRALHHPVPETSIRAARILGSLKSSGAVPALSKLVASDVDPFARAAAIEALGNIGDATVIPLLQARLNTHPTLVEHQELERALLNLSKSKESVS
jgi:HEAT repeat protein